MTKEQLYKAFQLGLRTIEAKYPSMFKNDRLSNYVELTEKADSFVLRWHDSNHISELIKTEVSQLLDGCLDQFSSGH